ncbi:MAG: hypothetical protein PHW46_04155, partial [Candidatus Omnitrophica bacterium]|nr:hypothetical protein [Candidatus Omnitrophota bacterium]
QAIAWYYSPLAILFAILCFGPLGLLLLWFRPKTSVLVKIAVSIVVIIVTIWFIKESITVYQELLEYYKTLAESTK